MQDSRVDVVIIGAGIAGLSAAQKLLKSGRTILILEARDRTGGRMRTESQEPGCAIDLGPEFIHGHPRQIWDIVDKESLPVYEVSEEHWYKRDGVITDSSEFFEGVDEVMSRLPAAQKDNPADLSFTDYLQQYCSEQSEPHKAAAKSFIEGFNAAFSDRIGVNGLVIENEAEEEIGDEAYRLMNGYQSLLDQVAIGITPSEARLNTVVKEIEWSRGAVQVTAHGPDGTLVVLARTALITLPLGVLKAGESSPSFVRFNPPLSSKTDALKKLEMGQVVKVLLRFKERIWEQSSLRTNKGETRSGAELGFLHSEHEYFPTWWTMRPLHVPLIVGWSAGPRAEKLRGKDKDFIVSQATESLSMGLGISVETVRASLLECHYHDWQNDPFSLGAYSYPGIGGGEAGKVLAEPLEGTLFFAGEHTNWQGIWATVHGAMQTGLRAADQVISAFSH